MGIKARTTRGLQAYRTRSLIPYYVVNHPGFYIREYFPSRERGWFKNRAPYYMEQRGLKRMFATHKGVSANLGGNT